MRFLYIFIIITNLLFALQYTKKEQNFLKIHPVIYFSAMDYWPVDQNGMSIHTNYIKLLNKYGHLNIQPVFYHYWSEGFLAAKERKTNGIMALSFSKQRTKYFYFTPPYNYTPYYLITLKKSPIKTFKDLRNKKVYIAKDSIIREVLKHPDFKIVWTKNPYKDLVKGKINAILTFYMPQNNYIKYLKTSKAFINRAGEEHIGINRHYPVLYHIILKAMNAIPYSKIEKIKSEYYYNPIPPVIITKPKVTLKELISPLDIAIVLFVILFFFIVSYYYLTRKHLNLPLKKFLLAILAVESVILISIVYEIFMFNYYSDKILALKSKSFNTLFFTDKLEQNIIILNNQFLRLEKHKKNSYSQLFKGKPNADNLIIESKPLTYYLNPQIIHPSVLAKISEIKINLQNLINMQQQILKQKIPISLYETNYRHILRQFAIIRNYIYNENKKEAAFIKDKLKFQFTLMIAITLIFIFSNILLFLMIKNKIYKPILYLTQTVQNFKKGLFVEKKFFYKDEVGVLINEFFSLQRQLSDIIYELKKHKENLEKQVKEEVQKRIFQEELLLKQSRFAMMGEIIDAIAHQWKQPLTTIKLLKDLYEHGDINKEEFIQNISQQIEFMQNTLNEFRNFFNNKKEQKIFSVKNITEKTLLLIKDDLIKHHITVKKEFLSDFYIKGYPNEFEHLILSIITNAKEAFNERNIKNRIITIKSYEDNDFYYYKISDNAGGIDEKIIDKIFDLNFSTKKDGSGIGLYLASLIAVKHSGILFAKNSKTGAEFIFKIKKEYDERN